MTTVIKNENSIWNQPLVKLFEKTTKINNSVSEFLTSIDNTSSRKTHYDFNQSKVRIAKDKKHTYIGAAFRVNSIVGAKDGTVQEEVQTSKTVAREELDKKHRVNKFIALRKVAEYRKTLNPKHINSENAFAKLFNDSEIRSEKALFKSYAFSEVTLQIIQNNVDLGKHQVKFAVEEFLVRSKRFLKNIHRPMVMSFRIIGRSIKKTIMKAIMKILKVYKVAKEFINKLIDKLPLVIRIPLKATYVVIQHIMLVPKVITVEFFKLIWGIFKYLDKMDDIQNSMIFTAIKWVSYAFTALMLIQFSAWALGFDFNLSDLLKAYSIEQAVGLVPEQDGAMASAIQEEVQELVHDNTEQALNKVNDQMQGAWDKFTFA